MQRSLSLIALSLSLAACGGGGSDSSNETPSTPTPTPTPTSYAVTVTTSSGGSASVTSQNVNEDDTLAITFTADSGFALSGVEGCDGTLDGTTYTTGAITAACTVDAQFSEVDTSVDITTAQNEGGTLYPASFTAQQGDAVSITVVPDATQMLDTISGCEGTLKGNIYSFTVAQDCEVTTAFAAQSDTSTRENAGGQKTLVLPIAFAGREELDGYSVSDLTAMFITDSDAINRVVVDASEGASWLEPHVLPYYTLTETNTAANGNTSGFTLIDNDVMIGDAQLQEVYAYIAANVPDYTSYDRLVTVFNDNPNQPYVCYSSLNHSGELASWDHYVSHNASACVSKAMFVHQLGHTFGMHHANSSKCATLPASTFAYRSTEECAVDGDVSPFPMGDSEDHSAAFSATMRNQAGWINNDRQAIVTTPSTVTLAQSSMPNGGVQLVRVPYARDTNGQPVYLNFELKTATGLDAELFSALEIDEPYQLLVSIPQTRITSDNSSPLDALYLMPAGGNAIGLTDEYVDTYRGISVTVTGTQGSGSALTATLEIVPPTMLPQPALSLLAGASASETTTVTLTNTSSESVTGITESLTGINPTHFSIQSSTCTNATLAADASCQVVVARTSSSPAFATVHFETSAGDVQQAEVEAIAINQPYDATASLEWMTLSDYPRMSLFEAVAFCENREDNGNTDWRVPTKEELNAAFVTSATAALDLTSATYDRYFWSQSVEADGSMSTLAVTDGTYSMADSPRSAIRHAVCTRSL